MHHDVKHSNSGIALAKGH